MAAMRRMVLCARGEAAAPTLLLGLGQRAICTRSRPRDWLPSLLGSRGPASLEWQASGRPLQSPPAWGIGSPVGYADIPLPPPAVRAIAEQNWAALDAEFPALQDHLPDSSSTRNHLLGTFGLLHLWRQSPAQCRAGLFHMAYMAPGSIPFGMWGESGNGGDVQDRMALRALIGAEAEEMVALMSSDALSWEKIASSILTGSPPDFAILPCGEHRSVARAEFAQLAIVAVADLAECAHDVVPPSDGEAEASGSQKAPAFYSGTMQPAVEMYWMSQLCDQLRHDLHSIPPIFDGCTRTIDRPSEVQARDAYWSVVQKQAKSGSIGLQEIWTLKDAVALNPFIAEPHALLSQALIQHGRWGEASQHAMRALHLFYQWGTPWDKRAPLRQWVAFTQMLLQEASMGRTGFSEAPLVAPSTLPLPEYSGPFIKPVIVHL
mmetsp:Transcript_15737/g.50041  ORF Transcript_15737/g.50041 Transcript_15737/m.50041 type:complete len:434 (-) Transcript_15737:178-1479(-)